MSAADASQMITAIALLLGSFGSIGTLVVSILNGRRSKERAEVATVERQVLAEKLEAVHKTTNGLSERNELIAERLGVEKGTAIGLQQGRDEKTNTSEHQP